MTSKIDFDVLEKTASQDGIEKRVVGACIMHDGKVLLLKRCLKEDFMPGLIELPSGGIEGGENLADALAREVLEETSLKISSVESYVGSFDYTSHSGRKSRQFNFVVKVEDISSLQLNDEEHSEYFWVDPSEDDLDQYNVSKSTLEIIKKI